MSEGREQCLSITPATFPWASFGGRTTSSESGTMIVEELPSCEVRRSRGGRKRGGRGRGGEGEERRRGGREEERAKRGGEGEEEGEGEERGRRGGGEGEEE